MNRIKELRLLKGLRQQDLCNALGVTQGTLSGWENQKHQPDLSMLRQLAELFDVSVSDVIGEERMIPVLGRVQAGIPIEAVEQMIDEIELPKYLRGQGEFFGLIVRGRSMEPKMENGDYIIVQKQESVDSGDIAVVLIDGNDATVKKITLHENGVSLIPYNPAFEPLFFDNQEIEELPVRILGKVVEIRRKI